MIFPHLNESSHAPLLGKTLTFNLLHLSPSNLTRGYFEGLPLNAMENPHE